MVGSVAVGGEALMTNAEYRMQNSEAKTYNLGQPNLLSQSDDSQEQHVSDRAERVDARGELAEHPLGHAPDHPLTDEVARHLP